MQLPLSNADPISLSQLEFHLRGAANSLRRPVGTADFKTCIFPLLFFKRNSNVYGEEQARALEESEGDKQYAGLPKQHRFQIPEGYRWREVRAWATDVGQALQIAFRKI